LKRIDIQDFIAFLKNPGLEEHYKINSISIFLRLVWKSFIVLMLIDIIAGILIVFPLRYFNLFPLLREFKFTPSNILKATLIFPIIEELIFRLPLRISKIYLATSFSLIILLVLNKWCFSNFYLALSFSLVLFLLLYMGITRESSSLDRLTTFFTNHFWVVFYFQAIIFGFLHLKNYIVDFRYFYLLPFIVISYISKGCLFGYLRVRYTFGIYLCIASHIVANSIYCLIFSH
jgi:hypothetical protein